MPRPKLAEFHTEEPVEKPIAVFVIGCGGHTEAIYFQKMVSARDDVRVEMLPPLTAQQSATEPNLSTPLQTVARIDKFWESLDKEEGDQVWVVLDVDHHFQGGHRSGTKQALDEAQTQNYSVVFSNPCFELWLLLHTEEVLAKWPDCASIETHLHKKWGSYSKKRFNVEILRPHVRDAMSRARRLRANSTQVPPQNPGTDVDYLMQSLDKACGNERIF